MSAHWIQGERKGLAQTPSSSWYCSNCGEKITYNTTPRTYQIHKRKVHEVNRFCRHCGERMEGAQTRGTNRP